MAAIQSWSKSPSANVLAAERPATPVLIATSRTGIALVIDDFALAEAVRAVLGARPELVEVDEDRADVIVTDRPPSRDAFASRRPVLSLGGAAGEKGHTLDSLDPALIVSAAAVLAAGYRIEREPERDGARRDTPPPHLSPREQQVATLLVDGASNKLIARQLDISVHTAKFHVTAVMEKLGDHNRADAVSLVLREGLVAL